MMESVLYVVMIVLGLLVGPLLFCTSLLALAESTGDGKRTTFREHVLPLLVSIVFIGTAWAAYMWIE